jgi:hypothetical protein
MNNINDQYLVNCFESFSSESQRLLNLIKNEKDDNTSKQLIKEINLIQSIELKLLKLKSLKSNMKPVKSLKK